ncbi:MAG: dethiobiotin synthase [Solirubrobacterales bacterium]
MLLSDPSAEHEIRGVFVAGTDTDVGKTVVASSLAATLDARGERVAVFKPVVTGLDELEATLPDHELLKASAGSSQRPDRIAPYRFGPAVSPHLAAQMVGTRIDPDLLMRRAREAARNATVLIVEGVGGLMAPLTSRYFVRDFASDLGLPLIVVARPGLGTINHTLLTIEAARSAGLEVASVVLTPWPHPPDDVALSNRLTIAERTCLPVFAIPQLEVGESVPPLVDALARSLLEPVLPRRRVATLTH